MSAEEKERGGTENKKKSSVFFSFLKNFFSLVRSFVFFISFFFTLSFLFFVFYIMYFLNHLDGSFLLSSLGIDRLISGNELSFLNPNFTKKTGGRIEEENILFIDLSLSNGGSFLKEIIPFSKFSSVNGEESVPQNIYDLIYVILHAAHDSRIKGLFIKLGDVTSINGFSFVEELNNVVSYFIKEKRKQFGNREQLDNYIFANNYDEKKYLIAIPFNNKFLSPEGQIRFNPNSSLKYYYRDALDVLGVRTYRFQKGPSKGFEEESFLSSPSTETLTSMKYLLLGKKQIIYSAILDGVNGIRNISLGQITSEVLDKISTDPLLFTGIPRDAFLFLSQTVKERTGVQYPIMSWKKAFETVSEQMNIISFNKYLYVLTKETNKNRTSKDAPPFPGILKIKEDLFSSLSSIYGLKEGKESPVDQRLKDRIGVYEDFVNSLQNTDFSIFEMAKERKRRGLVLSDIFSFEDDRSDQMFSLRDRRKKNANLLDSVQHEFFVSETEGTSLQKEQGITSFTENRKIKKGGKIAIIEIKGELLPEGSFYEMGFGREYTETRKIEQMIIAADNDQDISAIILYISSGGGALSTAHLYYSLLDVKKPLIAVLGDLGASAAYLISLGTDLIISSSSSLVGSIGVISSMKGINSNVLDFLGINYVKVDLGEVENAYDIHEGLTSSQTGRISKVLDENYKDFLLKVATRRGLSFEELKKVIGGKIFFGSHAYQLKLVDHLGGLMQGLYAAAYLGNLDKIDYVLYKKKWGGSSIFSLNLPLGKEDNSLLENLVKLINLFFRGSYN